MEKEMKKCDVLKVEWKPVPKRGWRVVNESGKIVFSNDDLEKCYEWLERNGYTEQIGSKG